MTRVCLGILLFLQLACGGCGESTPRRHDHVRVMSYNIHHGRGTDGKFDYERIAAVINAEKPDLVALQEVDRKTTRSSGVDQAAKLGELTGMHHVYGAAMPYAGGEYGEAILSRWPILSFKNHVLPKIEGSEPRALLLVRVEAPGGQSIVFAGTHLAHDSEADRTSQMERIREILARESMDDPVILAGDLNATPGSAPMRVLLDGTLLWLDAFEMDPAPTYPNVNPDRRIDWILVRPGNNDAHLLQMSVVVGNVASDHCAIAVSMHFSSRLGP